MFMNVGYTPPPPVWPPKTSSNGMGLYLPQNFVTPQRLIAALQSARIEIPHGWGDSCDGMGAYERQNFVTPQRLLAALQSAQIEIPAGWATPTMKPGMGCCASCANGGSCEGHSHGMGQLFESGTDISGWGWPEWSIVGVGAAAGLALLNDISSGARNVTKAIRRRRRAS